MHQHDVLAGYLRKSRKPTLEQIALGATADFIARQRKKALKAGMSKDTLPSRLVSPSSLLAIRPTSVAPSSFGTELPEESKSAVEAAEKPKSNKGLVVGGVILAAALIGGGIFLASRKK